MGINMRKALVLAAAGSLVEASPYAAYGHGNVTTPSVVYTTEVVTALTTYCPAATTLTYNDKTYTITSATTLTITDCPCTLTKTKPSSPEPTADECATECYTKYNECRGKAGANMSWCAAQYAECLGYSPFDNSGSLVTPPACSSRAPYTSPTAAPTTEEGVHYTTEVVTALTTYCPAATTLTHNDKTYTITKPTTLTITDCPCTISKPVTKPVVYTTEVVTELTTYCPEPTTLSFGNKTYTVTEPTTLTVKECPCTVTKPSGPAPTAPAPSQPAKTCPEECTDAYNTCRGKADANRATCAAEYASCLGYNPFNGEGSLVTPSACSKAPLSTTAPVVPGTTAPSKPTYSVPVVGKPSESASVVIPTGTAPASVPTTPVAIPTAAAGRITPANILLALGAVALL